MSGTGGGALSHDRSYFVERFAQDPDPWGFDRRWYERRKHTLTVAALPARRYRRALEPGCANGALTERLAPRCAELVAHDIVPAAVERATARMSGHPHVTVRERAFPTWWPDGDGDLVVWSEVAYYLTADGRARAAAGAARWLVPGGHLVAVHWTGETDHPASGTDTHRWIEGLDFLEPLVTHHDREFVLGIWQRRGG